jgi:glycosyltransferase involved in cell wall biosynthesis
MSQKDAACGKAPERIEHLLPDGGVAGAVELSIVVPAMNERITVGEFVDWCREGLETAGVPGQILIVDSSTDETPETALKHGAEVLRTPKRGLGRAYIDSIPYIRGNWIIMGDADLTYDFRHLGGFIEKFREGCEFIMGSRFKGTIEKGAMPPLHQYFWNAADDMDAQRHLRRGVFRHPLRDAWGDA